MDAETVAEIFIRRFYRQHGLFAIIISERGRQFVNILWKKICKIFSIERRFSIIYHSQIDKTTGRMNQTVEIFLRIYIDFDQRNWGKLLFTTKFVINNKNAVSTGVNFYFIFYFIFYFSRISRENFTTDKKLHAAENKIKNFIQKTDNIFTELKQTNDLVQTAMAVAQQNQQKYIDKFNIQTPKYEIKYKI